MKQIYWCLLLACSSALAQNNNESAGHEYDGVAGSPYLLKDWVNGTVYYKNGRIVNQFKLRFDCPHNFLQLEFKGHIFSPQPTSITSFVLYPKKNAKDSLVFRKGYPDIGHYNTETFYQVLVPGKASLLYLLSKIIIEEKGITPGSGKKFFQEEDQFFLYTDGAMKELIFADREALAAQFPAQEKTLLKYMIEEQLKMKSAEDFKKFAVKFNELIQ